MKPKALIIDLDNVIVDTSIRKKKLLKSEFGIEKSLEEIRIDYELKSVFGNIESATYKKFFRILNAKGTISQYKAEVFSGAVEIIKNFIKKGIKPIILSSRYKSCLNETIEELLGFGLEKEEFDLILAPQELMDETPIKLYKSKEVECLLQNYDVLAIIGDRPSDIHAGIDNNLPTIFFSVSRKFESFSNPRGHFCCFEWKEIEDIITKINNGKHKVLSELRKIMIEQYSKWLSDIDNKLRISVTISGILSAISGKLIHDGLELSSKYYDPDFLGSLSLICCFIFAMISLIFSIHGYTSRHTSGQNAANQILPSLVVSENQKYFQKIKSRVSNMFSSKMFELLTLINNKNRYKHLPEEDYINRYNYIKNNEKELPDEHYRFFYKKYKTYDEDALLNLRLFAVLATNYSKAYPERFASKWLIRSVTMILFYIVFEILSQLLIL